MLFRTIFAAAAMAGSAMAGFDIRTGLTEWWASDEAEVSPQLANQEAKHILTLFSPHRLPVLYPKPLAAMKQLLRPNLMRRAQRPPSTDMHEHAMVFQRSSPRQAPSIPVTLRSPIGKHITLLARF